ncbi:ATP-grasp domain-containing protein [Frankia gtarii]|uniref:ATP-grasp domain-containing protein n=1 Tax=Frankia gtarii TaxID=2950102 RepID=UPI0021BEB3DF|nr:hypothetical protein [Frankia gtarii]
MSAPRRLVVPYGQGSLAPTRLAQAAGADAVELVFVVDEQEHARQMLPTLAMLGAVVDAAGRDTDEVASMVAAHEPAGIATFSEFHIEATARLAQRLELPYHAVDDLPWITCKDAQRRRLAEAGVEQVAAATLTDPADAGAAVARVGLPAIVKPVRGASSRNTLRVRTGDEAVAAVTAALGGHGPTPRESAVLLEELLVGQPRPAPWGDYIAVDCVVASGRARPMFVTSKFALAEPFRERGGYGAASVEDDAVVTAAEALACRAVEAVGITEGIADVEIKLTPDGPRVIEINGRLGAWVDDLAVRTGAADPARLAVRAAVGLPLPGRLAVPRAPIAFHYLLVPPTGARAVAAIDDVPALRRVPNVQKVIVLAEPGADVDWRLGAAANVAAVVGVAHDHASLADTVRRIEEVTWIRYHYH